MSKKQNKNKAVPHPCADCGVTVRRAVRCDSCKRKNQNTRIRDAQVAKNPWVKR